MIWEKPVFLLPFMKTKFSLKIFNEDTDYLLWDEFLFNQTSNHTVLHSRKFLSYHNKTSRFLDNSILIYLDDSIIAILPAVIEKNGSDVSLSSHPGSTFGGILLSSESFTLVFLDELISFIDDYFSIQGFDNIRFRLAPSKLLFEPSQEMIIYTLSRNGYSANFELGYSINLQEDLKTIESKYSKMRITNIKKANQKGLIFRQISSSEIDFFYTILESNLKKYEVTPVHSLDEIKMLINVNLKGESYVYGVFADSILIAATFILIYNSKTAHCQYFAMNYDYRNLYPMEYLIQQTVITFKDLNYEELSLGIVTENQGGEFNSGLSQFKESFGAEPYNIITMKKRLTQYG